jgi:hypothetical protein
MAPRLGCGAQLWPRSPLARHHHAPPRPDWLANGIYSTLRANDTRHAEPLARDGRWDRHVGELGRIYNAAEKLGIYTREKWPFVLRLMSKEQLPLLQSPRCCGALSLLAVRHPGCSRRRETDSSGDAPASFKGFA